MDAKFDEGIFQGYSLKSKAYRVCNQNSQVIQEYYNVVINNTRYGQEIIEGQISIQESIRGNLEIVETIKDNPNDIPERDILTLTMIKVYL